MPYCGIHSHQGPAAIASTFETVASIWKNEAFEILSCFSDEDSSNQNHGSNRVGERGGGGSTDDNSSADESGGMKSKNIVNVAMFGSFKYRSTVLKKGYESPFSIWCQVDMGMGEEPEQKGRVVFMQFVSGLSLFFFFLCCCRGGQLYGRELTQ